MCWRKAPIGKTHAGDAAEAIFAVPDLGGLDDLGAAVLVLLAAVVVAVVVIPLLLFGIELIALRVRQLVEGTRGVQWR